MSERTSPVQPVPVRERLADVIADQLEGYAPAYLLDYGCVDALLAEIGTTHRLVEKGRWRRVYGFARQHRDSIGGRHWMRPSDTDEPVPAEEQR